MMSYHIIIPEPLNKKVVSKKLSLENNKKKKKKVSSVTLACEGDKFSRHTKWIHKLKHLNGKRK